MIGIPSPSLGLNASNSPAFVNMDVNWTVPPGTETIDIIQRVRSMASNAPGGRFRSIVFSTHGTQAFIALGAGFTYLDIGKFKFWNGMVEQIWIRSCSTARIRPQFDNPVGSANGHSFCSKIADIANCYVIAPTEKQVRGYAGSTLPPGMLDTFEGRIVCYGPGGNIVSHFRLPSTYEIEPNRWHANPA